MSPKSTHLSLPLDRLPATCVAVVVVGTFFIETGAPPFLRVPESPGQALGMESEVPPTTVLAVVEAAPGPIERPAISEAVEVRSAPPTIRTRWCTDSEPEPRVPELPAPRVEADRTAIGREAILEFRPRSRWGWAEEAGNALFSGPERLVDLAVHGLGSLFPDEPTTWIETEHRGFVERFCEGIDRFHGDGRTFSRFVDALFDREVRFFSGFRDNYLYSFEVEDGEAPVGASEFGSEQRNLLWDALSETYLGRFRRMGEQVREQAYRVDLWQGLDYVVAPVVIGAGIYFRGIQREIAIGSVRVRVEAASIQDALDRWRRSDAEDLRVALGAEWGVAGIPVRLMVTMGIYGGDPEFEFVGVGTGLSEVKKLLGYLYER